MADNVTIKDSSLTNNTVAADELTDGTLGSVKVQYVKIMDADLGSSTKYGTTNAFPVTGTLTGITNSVAIHLLSTAGTVQIKTDPSSVIQISNAPTITGITNSVNVYLGGTAGTLGARVGQVDGTVAVQFSPANPAVNAQFGNIGHTASIFTASGTAASAGNNTIVSPSASYNFKVFAYSIQTTGAVSIASRFTTGASAGATELWRPLVTASGVTGAQGANLAVVAPGFIFATGTNTTLSLFLDSATLVHYSVSYIKETA